MDNEPEDTRDSALNRLTDASGLIIAYPAAGSDRLAVLRLLAARIVPGQNYSEHEINALIQQHVHPDAVDHVTLRRDLIDYQLIYRTSGGARYWRSEHSEGIPPRVQVGKGSVGAPHVDESQEEP